MTSKTIVILSYYYHPQITPRAFRAKELAAEFIRRNWSVILITPNGLFRDQEILDLHYKQPSSPQIQIPISRPSRVKSLIMNACRRLLPGGSDLLGSFKILRHGAKIKINADIVISIGLPFSVHLSTFILKKIKSIKSTRFIADYGDPYSAMEKRYNGCLYAPTIERFVLRGFDEITVPVSSAKPEFKHVTDLNKIYLSPQGLDITQFSLSKYEEQSNKTRFAYAGLFYSDIRNPSVLFEHLATLNYDVEFHIYTRLNHDATREILEKYGSANNVIIHEALPRDKCIFELSKYDFLINIENEIESQTPSKLIDYSIAGRPVFSFKSSAFYQKHFDSFINKDYDRSISLDPSKFSIVTVVDNLIDKKNHV